MTLDTSTPNVVQLTFTALPGQSLGSAHPLARLNFTIAPQTSAFIPLQLANVASVRAQAGLAPGVLLDHGRVTVVDGAPLLEAMNLPGGGRTLILYGLPGTNYTIETSTNPVNPAAWQSWHSMTPASLSETMDASSSSNAPMIFYRARQ